MSSTLEGRVAFITGAARGQGRAIAERLAADGAHVVATDICQPIPGIEYQMSTETDLAETRQLVEKHGRACLATVADVRSQADLDRATQLALEEFGRIDILCANAGVFHCAPFWQLTEEDWQTQIAVNLTGVWHSAKAVAKHMIDRKQGVMVFTSSINAHEAATPFAHYVAAKHGVVGLMKSVALELGSYGVRVNSVLPGPVDTVMANGSHNLDRMLGRSGGTHNEFVEATRSWMLLRGTAALPPAAIANGVAWLVSDDARYVTGLELVIDCGHMLLPGFNHAPERDAPIAATRSFESRVP